MSRREVGMAWVFVVPLVGFVVFLVVGAVTGHVTMSSCCGIADPRCDTRMREAFLDDAKDPQTSQPLDR